MELGGHSPLLLCLHKSPCLYWQWHKFLCFCVAGVHSVAYAFPKLKIVTTAVDEEVNEKFHILPGIGTSTFLVFFFFFSFFFFPVVLLRFQHCVDTC